MRTKKQKKQSCEFDINKGTFDIEPDDIILFKAKPVHQCPDEVWEKLWDKTFKERKNED